MELSNNIRLLIALLLIFTIIFRNKIDFLENKKVYYIFFIIFCMNIFFLHKNPGIILLFSILFLFMWFDQYIY